jgi:hypothetical protein
MLLIQAFNFFELHLQPYYVQIIKQIVLGFHKWTFFINVWISACPLIQRANVNHFKLEYCLLITFMSDRERFCENMSFCPETTSDIIHVDMYK